jgi:hypothetical protein
VSGCRADRADAALAADDPQVELGLHRVDRVVLNGTGIREQPQRDDL